MVWSTSVSGFELDDGMTFALLIDAINGVILFRIGCIGVVSVKCWCISCDVTAISYGSKVFTGSFGLNLLALWNGFHVGFAGLLL